MRAQPMNAAQTQIAARLTERLMVAVIDTFQDEEGGSRVNLDLAEPCMLHVMAYLAALRPELTTPAEVERFAEGIGERLTELILSAQASHETSGIHEHVTVSKVVLS